VTLPLDPAAAARVERMREAFGLPEPDYPPHLTLAVLPDEAEREAVEAAVFGVAAGWNVLPLVLAGIGMFPGEAPVIWVTPAPSERLLAMHAELLAALAAFEIHPHYRVEVWVPHVTLGRGELPARAASAWDGPIEALLERVGLVAFPPARVLRGESLRRAP